MKNKNKLIIAIVSLIILILITIISTYALLNINVKSTNNYQFAIGKFKTVIGGEKNPVKLEAAYPMSDNSGKKVKPYTFTLTNSSNVKVNYTLTFNSDLTNTLKNDKVKIYVTEGKKIVGPKLLSESSIIDEGIMEPNETKEYSLRIWLDYNTTIEDMNKQFKGKIYAEATQRVKDFYKDNSGAAEPKIKGDLIPVTILNDGTVKKADITKKWYDYNNKEWANAVILEDKTRTYLTGEIIKEEDIESYFVWIPRYKYKLFNANNENKLAQEIEIQFEDREISPSIGTSNGEWLTHPAFTSFDVNGIWVGKFETGYKGATKSRDAQGKTTSQDKLIVKPLTYSWRGITVKTAFDAVYKYDRYLDSHMMKNTEWGAVAYLSHSKYGRCNNNSCEEIMINNDKNFITGKAGNTTADPESDTVHNYNTELGYKASTTGNITGIYDMNGGSWEYVMGYTMKATNPGGSSGFTEEWFNDLNNKKYFDAYHSTSASQFNDKILGDATGETKRWYNDFSQFIYMGHPWFVRSGTYGNKASSGIFANYSTHGNSNSSYSFRAVLAP